MKALLGLALAAGAATAQEALDQPLRLRRSGQLEEALSLTDERLAAAPKDAGLLGLRGLLLLDTGRTKDAARLASALADYAGGEFRVHLFLGRCALEGGQPEAAVPHLKRAVEANPEGVEPASSLVQALIAAGKLKPALTQAERLESFAPELGAKLAARAYLAQAQRHREQGEEAAALAIDDYRNALEKQPQDPAIARMLVETLLDFSFSGEARAVLEAHFDRAAQPVDWHHYSGRCHAVRLELADAERELRAVLTHDARHAPTLVELGKLALDDGRTSQAREWFAMATEVEPDSARAWLLLGQAREGLADDDGAETAYRRACALSPANVKAHYVLGRLLVRTGRDAEGEPLLRLAVADSR